MLHLGVQSESEYLPLAYQIQAVETKVIELEGQIKADEQWYNYYKDLLVLNERILAELNDNLSSNYGIVEFKSFLVRLVENVEKQELKDYLNSYIKKIENRISVSAPVTEKPTIRPISKGAVKKNAVVFGVALILSIFASFLLEGFQKSTA